MMERNTTAQDAVRSLRSRLPSATEDLFESGGAVNGHDIGARAPSLLLRKHAKAVHASTPMNASQRKIYNVLLYVAQKDFQNPQIKLHGIKISDLATLVGSESKNTPFYRAQLKSLLTCTMEFNLIEENGTDRWDACAALAGVSFRNGYCYYEFSQFLREHFGHPERFAKIYIDDMRGLTLTAAVCLYENVVRYINLGSSPIFPLETLRQLLCATAESYKDFRRFNQRVLAPAIAQINEETSFSLRPEPQYVHRVVAGIRFHVEAKEAHVVRAEVSVPSAPDPAMVDRIAREMKLTHSQSVDVCTRYDQQRIEQVLSYVAKQYSAGKVDNLPGYFLRLMDRFEAQPTQTSLDQERNERERIAGEAKAAAAKAVAQAKALRDRWDQMREDAWEALTPDEQARFRELFDEQVQSDPIAQRYYRESKMDTPMMQAHWRQFIASKLLPDRSEALVEESPE